MNPRAVGFLFLILATVLIASSQAVPDTWPISWMWVGTVILFIFSAAAFGRHFRNSAD